jgi:outer membrane protein OmpU
MKKVLFATSALVATAGMAAADVSLGGSGRVGIVYNSANDNVAGADSFKVGRRMTINIDGSGETDVGLSFGGRIRLRSDEGDTVSTASSSNIRIGTDSWRLTVGNTSGAAAYRVGYFQGSVGLTGLQDANVSFNIGTSDFTLASYSSQGNAGDVVRLDFNLGDLGVSASLDSTGDDASNGQESAIAISYNFGDWSTSLAYTDERGLGVGTPSSSVISLSASGSIADFGVGFQYTDKENIGDKFVIDANYDFGPTTVIGFVAMTTVDAAGTLGFAAGEDNATEFGIGVTHSLGGATLAGGVSYDYTEQTMVDMGILFSF